METLVEIAKRLGIKPNAHITDEEYKDIEKRILDELRKIGRPKTVTSDLADSVYNIRKCAGVADEYDQERYAENIKAFKEEFLEGISAYPDGYFFYHRAANVLGIERFVADLKMDSPDIGEVFKKLDEFILKYKGAYKIRIYEKDWKITRRPNDTNRTDMLNLYMPQSITEEMAREFYEIVKPVLEERTYEFLDGFPITRNGEPIKGIKFGPEVEEWTMEKAHSAGERIRAIFPKKMANDLFNCSKNAKSLGEMVAATQLGDLMYYLIGQEGKNPFQVGNQYGDPKKKYDKVLDISDETIEEMKIDPKTTIKENEMTDKNPEQDTTRKELTAEQKKNLEVLIQKMLRSGDYTLDELKNVVSVCVPENCSISVDQDGKIEYVIKGGDIVKSQHLFFKGLDYKGDIIVFDSGSVGLSFGCKDDTKGNWYIDRWWNDDGTLRKEELRSNIGDWKEQKLEKHKTPETKVLKREYQDGVLSSEIETDAEGKILSEKTFDKVEEKPAEAAHVGAEPETKELTSEQKKNLEALIQKISKGENYTAEDLKKLVNDCVPEGRSIGINQDGKITYDSTSFGKKSFSIEGTDHRGWIYLYDNGSISLEFSHKDDEKGNWYLKCRWNEDGKIQSEEQRSPIGDWKALYPELEKTSGSQVIERNYVNGILQYETKTDADGNGERQYFDGKGNIIGKKKIEKGVEIEEVNDELQAKEPEATASETVDNENADTTGAEEKSAEAARHEAEAKDKKPAKDATRKTGAEKPEEAAVGDASSEQSGRKTKTKKTTKKTASRSAKKAEERFEFDVRRKIVTRIVTKGNKRHVEEIWFRPNPLIPTRYSHDEVREKSGVWKAVEIPAETVGKLSAPYMEDSKGNMTLVDHLKNSALIKKYNDMLKGAEEKAKKSEETTKVTWTFVKKKGKDEEGRDNVIATKFETVKTETGYRRIVTEYHLDAYEDKGKVQQSRYKRSYTHIEELDENKKLIEKRLPVGMGAVSERTHYNGSLRKKLEEYIKDPTVRGNLDDDNAGNLSKFTYLTEGEISQIHKIWKGGHYQVEDLIIPPEVTDENRGRKEEDDRRRTEEDDRRRKEEDDRRRKEEDDRRRKEEDDRRRKEEDDRRRKEEDDRRRKEEDDRRRKEDDDRRRKEDDDRRRKEEDDRRRKEEDDRHRKEEDDRRRKEEDDRRRKEDDDRRRKEEDDRRRKEDEKREIDWRDPESWDKIKRKGNAIIKDMGKNDVVRFLDATSLPPDEFGKMIEIMKNAGIVFADNVNINLPRDKQSELGWSKIVTEKQMNTKWWRQLEFKTRYGISEGMKCLDSSSVQSAFDDNPENQTVVVAGVHDIEILNKLLNKEERENWFKRNMPWLLPLFALGAVLWTKFGQMESKTEAPKEEPRVEHVEEKSGAQRQETVKKTPKLKKIVKTKKPTVVQAKKVMADTDSVEINGVKVNRKDLLGVTVNVKMYQRTVGGGGHSSGHDIYKDVPVVVYIGVDSLVRNFGSGDINDFAKIIDNLRDGNCEIASQGLYHRASQVDSAIIRTTDYGIFKGPTMKARLDAHNFASMLEMAKHGVKVHQLMPDGTIKPVEFVKMKDGSLRPALSIQMEDGTTKQVVVDDNGNSIGTLGRSASGKKIIISHNKKGRMTIQAKMRRDRGLPPL